MGTFRIILLIENIVCVYRNFSWLGKFKYLILFRILFEITFIVSIVVIYRICLEKVTLEEFYFSMSFINSVAVIVLSAYNSKSFKKAIKQFEDFKLYFPDDDVYERKLKDKKKNIIYVSFIHNVYSIISHAASFMTVPRPSRFINICPSSIYYLLKCNVYMSDYRYIVEFPVIYDYFLLMSDQLDCIARSVIVEIDVLNKHKIENKLDGTYYCKYKNGNKFDKWSSAYTVVEKNSKLYKTIFGLQITILIIVMVVFYIILIYGITSLIYTGKFSPLLEFMYLFTLSEFMVALFMLSRAAQRTNNSANALRRRLSTLLVHSLGCEKQYKATRDFLRLVRTHPIETSAFGCINVDMTLMPTCIAFCTSYTVIALQFNNIL